MNKNCSTVDCTHNKSALRLVHQYVSVILEQGLTSTVRSFNSRTIIKLAHQTAVLQFDPSAAVVDTILVLTTVNLRVFVYLHKNILILELDYQCYRGLWYLHTHEINRSCVLVTGI